MSTLRHSQLFTCVIGVAICAIASGGYAAAPVILGGDVPQQQRIPADQIDHSAWDALLEKYVNERGLVNYSAWKASPVDVQTLDTYLNHLSAASLSRTTDARWQLAYWINAYNAVTIKGILLEYPTTSIRNHTARFYGYNIWKDLQLRVEGRTYSLDQIEHEVLRKMGEPRIHFAIVCASIGCPRLLNEAYEADTLEQQLTTNAKSFFADPSKFRYDSQQKSMLVSPILDWFKEDFGSTEAERLRQIAPYVPNAAARQLVEESGVQVSYLDYDWSLNEQAKVDNAASR